MALLLEARPARAREVGGIDVPDAVRLEENAPALRIAGAGVFRYFFMRYYVCALYFAEGVSGVDALQSNRPRRVELVALRRHFGVRVPLGPGSRPRRQLQRAGIAGGRRIAAGAARSDPRDRHACGRGTRCDRYLPHAGTRIVVDNRVRGGPFAGKALNDALLKVWIGQRPLDSSLKEVLLGG